MTARLLAAHALATPCDPTTLEPALNRPAVGTEVSEPAAPIVGQERARAAVDFAVAMRRPGYHLFVAGPPGSGKRSLVRHAVDVHLAGGAVRRADWVYVHNFDRAHQPIALRLPAGRGAGLRDDMRTLIEELRATIPAAFESEEYVAELEQLNTDFKESAEGGLIEVGNEAQQRGLVMLRTPVGFTFAPRKDGEVMSTKDFEALPADERERLQHAVGELQDKLVHALRASMKLRKEHVDRVRTLNRSTSKLAVDHAIDELKASCADLPEVGTHLEAVRTAVIENAEAFRSHEDGEGGASHGDLSRFEVNLVVDAAGSDGEAIFEADLPSVQNLVGRIDHNAQFGMLVTDFRHIKAGLLHRANGGYLLVDALKLLSQPFAWPALKRALLRNEIRIETMAEMFGMVSTVQLEPQPIPLDVKVALLGDREIWRLLQIHDPEFDALFRVVADLGDDLPRQADTQQALARSLAAQAGSSGLLPPDPSALARVIDHGSRRSGDAARISADVRHLLDVMHEADQLARAAQGRTLEREHIEAAIAARRERAARVDERLREATMRDLLAIATSGERIGQVNGLAAYGVGDETFGAPSRITATTRLGEGQLIDIQRETSMAGPVHAKGVLILSSFLAARFSRYQPHSIIGSLVFEQTYGMVEGDSASLAELLALLSSIGDLPLRQGLAVTGSVDQFGNVQAVGAVNEKVEGFFDLCRARGLDGAQGVVVPSANAPQLMLRADLVSAVAGGQFAVHAVDTVDDAMQVLTGLPAGETNAASEDTVNGRIVKRLREYASLRRGEPRFMRRHPARVLRIGTGRTGS